MPIHEGHDSQGTYMQWGGHGAKYYYGQGHGSKEEAIHRAAAQARAAYAHGYRE